MSQVKDDKKKMQQKSRQPYQVPHLFVYGTLQDLTAAGSGSSTEQNPGQGTTTKRP